MFIYLKIIFVIFVSTAYFREHSVFLIYLQKKSAPKDAVALICAAPRYFTALKLISRLL